ncbi:biotin--[acetyl-CoA-carboxylase] ligase [Azohydromonas caseinilytica]|uniref:biotin--[biotin carboxyl-carrier protein] ligase n=1 Tax=Azohydromonas caseinilytica TaxID=2728836 RepID=A0A848F9K6_9BURK|nr:biotin--[acetyl-CoA-carboxylase] ligase [Azohydromonas caseinilytica]NML16224.1 biotin--[acetyl-CoA-carboxylase] ligase [Azohydromonas caseinilytica]
MNESRLPWQAEALWRQLQPLLPGLSIEVVAHADSTNTRLLERARLSGGRHERALIRAPEAPPAPNEPPTPLGRRADDTQPCLLVAEHQTRGRGRLGRTWQSTPGASLTFSLSLPFEPVDWSGLSLSVGVALADALDPLQPGQAPRIGLKWPNDLWLIDAPVVGRKLGGVLIETVAVGRRRMAVVGVGLNLHPQPVRDAASGVASLSELDPAVTAPATLHRVALSLAQVLRQHEREGFRPFVERYARRDLLQGRPVTTTAPALEGIARGVAEDGALLVETPQGLQRLSSGEVSVRLAGMPVDGAS